MFLMAYGERDLRLSNFDDYTPDDAFEEITGITEHEFRVCPEENCAMSPRFQVCSSQAVLTQSVQEFLDK